MEKVITLKRNAAPWHDGGGPCFVACLDGLPIRCGFTKTFDILFPAKDELDAYRIVNNYLRKQDETRTNGSAGAAGREAWLNEAMGSAREEPSVVGEGEVIWQP